jgi:UDP-galactopyranose mutase
MNFDWIVVGAGFAGAVLAERLASQSRQRVLIVERRDHIAGNAFDYLMKKACWSTSMGRTYSTQTAKT